jgi:hypothetical protein
MTPMGLKDLLSRNERVILKRWFDLILETYSADTATLMRKDKDQFTNPVGSTLSRGIEVLFKKICKVRSVRHLWIRFLRFDQFRTSLPRKRSDLFFC